MNAIERCARTGPKKLTKTYNKGVLSFEKGETCQSILMMFRGENSLRLTLSKKESVVCEALFYLK